MYFLDNPLIYRIHLCLWVILLCPYNSNAQQFGSTIEQIGIKQGLSNNEIRCIFQDHTGFMWFGTYDGLNRYDGYAFKVFRNNPNRTNTIVDNWINCISEDKTQNIWVGTRRGLSILNTRTDTFFSVSAHRSNADSYSKINGIISDIVCTSSGTILVGTQDQGLIIFPKNSAFRGTFVPINLSGQLRNNYEVSKISIGDHGEIYMVANGGLYQFDQERRTFKLLTPSNVSASAFVVQGNDLWIGNGEGLLRFNTINRRFDFTLNEKNGLSYNRVTSIMPVKENEIWVATDGGGVNIINPQTLEIRSITHGTGRFNLSSNAIYALYMDQEKRKWIGTLRGGINIIDENKNGFNNITHNDLDPNSLISDFVKCIYETSSGHVLIGTDGGGLSVWDRSNNSFTNYKYVKGINNGLSSNFITGILEDDRRNIWVATFDGGVNRFQLEKGTFAHYTGVDKSGKPIGIVMWGLFEDHLKRLWASGLQDGLYLYNPSKDWFELYNADIKNILCFAEDRQGILWGGTFDGIYLINGKAIKHYQIGRPVRTIQPDGKGLWLGTEAGLMFFDLDKLSVTQRYTTDDGLNNNNVLAIESDGQGCLWLATYNGLSKFEMATKKFTNYFQSDGLLNREFNYNSSAHLRTGELAFGGINGLTLFAPRNIKPLNDRPRLVITDIMINNKPANECQDYFQYDQAKLSAIQVPFSQASLNITFAALEFSSQDRIKYRYRLIGWDHNWNNSGNSRVAAYTRLDPGSYTLQINCTNAEGKWLSNYIILEITVRPPWYFSWWAFTCYFVIVVICVYWYIRNKFRQNQLKYEIGIAKTKAEHQEAIQQKERELNERKLEFFTGVAHEFRTPLTLIINPLADYLNRNAESELKTVFRNAKRLLRLVDQLLLFRKTETSLPEISISQISVSEVCEDVLEYFRQTAKAADITLEFIHEEKPILIYGDRERFEIILFNLLSNAIKFTPPKGKVAIRVTEAEETVNIAVIDSGPGISPLVSDKIFEKFYRPIESGKSTKTGFGIGLYIAKQFANDHQAQLTFKSGETGTTFLLTIKKGYVHFGSDVVSVNAAPPSALLNELSEQSLINTLKPSSLTENAELLIDKKTVLLIDDDDELRAYIKSLLERKYYVFEASNGEMGLQLTREKKPDLIICDIVMSGMSGIDVCEKIKSDAALSFIPFILLTANTSAPQKLDGLKKGADDYIFKPFDTELLVARVDNLLLSRRNLQQYFYNAITLRTNEITVSEDYRQFLEKCIEVVELHLTDPSFNVQGLCDKLNMSHSNVYRKVKSLSGHSINSFIRFIRLRKAAELLIQSDLNVNEVALETGFNDMKYFRNQFSKLFKVPPSDFLKTNRPIFNKRIKLSE